MDTNKLQIWFNGVPWSVSCVEAGHTKLDPEPQGDSTFGITRYDELGCYIRVTDISPFLIERVCRHEAVHMALFSYGFDSNNMNEEDICNFFECYGKEIIAISDRMTEFARGEMCRY